MTIGEIQYRTYGTVLVVRRPRPRRPRGLAVRLDGRSRRAALAPAGASESHVNSLHVGAHRLVPARAPQAGAHRRLPRLERRRPGRVARRRLPREAVGTPQRFAEIDSEGFYDFQADAAARLARRRADAEDRVARRTRSSTRRSPAPTATPSSCSASSRTSAGGRSRASSSTSRRSSESSSSSRSARSSPTFRTRGRRR